MRTDQIIFSGRAMVVLSDSMQFERPLFYRQPYGLRFELGPPDIDVWSDSVEEGAFNETYFEVALERGLSIFEAAFAPSDRVSVIYQIFSDGRRRIKKGNYLFNQIKNIESKSIAFSDHRDIHPEHLSYKCECWRRVTVSGMSASDLHIKNILRALINKDFLKRRPSIAGECYLVNHTQGLVLDLYDDRGMDVVAPNKESLIGLYRSHHPYILEYDKAQIEQRFS